MGGIINSINSHPPTPPSPQQQMANAIQQMQEQAAAAKKHPGIQATKVEILQDRMEIAQSLQAGDIPGAMRAMSELIEDVKRLKELEAKRDDA